MVEIQNVHNIKELKSFQFKFLKKNKTKQMAGLCSVIAPTTAQDTWNNRTQKQRWQRAARHRDCYNMRSPRYPRAI